MSVAVPRRLQPEALRRKRDEHREPTKRSFILNLNFVKKAPLPAHPPPEVVPPKPPIVEEPKAKPPQRDENKVASQSLKKEKETEKRKEPKTKRKATKASVTPDVLEQSVDYLPPSPLPSSPKVGTEASVSVDSTENVSSLPELDALLDHSFESMLSSPPPPEKPSIRHSPPKSKPQEKRQPSPKSKQTDKPKVRQPSPPKKVQEKPAIRQSPPKPKPQEKIRQPSPPSKPQSAAAPKKSKPAPTSTKELEITKAAKIQPAPTKETVRPRPPSPKEQPPSPRHKPKQAPPSPITKSKGDEKQQRDTKEKSLAKTTHEEPKEPKKKEVFKRKEKRKGEDALGGGGKRRKTEATENGDSKSTIRSSKDLSTTTTTTKKAGGWKGTENGTLGVPKKKRKHIEAKGDGGPAPKRKKAQPKEIDLILDAIVDTMKAFGIKEKGRVNKEVTLLMEGITDEVSTQEEQYKKLKNADSKGRARVKKLRHKLLKMEKKRIARDFEMLNKKKELERLEEERKRMEGLHSFLSDMDLLSEFAPKTDSMQGKVCTLEGTVMRTHATIQSANTLKGIIKDFRGCLRMLDHYITQQNGAS